MANQEISNELKWRERGGEAFTTGAHIKAIQIDNQWHWIVAGFMDETYFDGKPMTVKVSEPSREQLVTTLGEQIAGNSGEQ